MRAALRLVQVALILGGLAILIEGAFVARLEDVPLYLTFLALSLPLAFAYVPALRRVPVPFPNVAASIAFTYIGGLPIVALRLLEPLGHSLLYRALCLASSRAAAWKPFYVTFGEELPPRGRVLASVAFCCGLGIRAILFRALAPTTPLDWFLAIAICEASGFAFWSFLAVLPIYGGRPLVAGPQVAVGDLLLLAPVVVLPAVYLIVVSYRELGLAGAAVWTLATLGMHFVVQRMNDRREVVEAQNRRLEAMNRELKHTERLSTIGRMSSVISHQLLHQLGIIGLSADLIRTVDLADEADARADRVRERVDQIEHALGEANRVMTDLLVFGKDRRLTLYETDLRAFLEECARDHEVSASHAGVRLEVRGQETCRVPVDRVKLRQVIANLLQNAIEVSLPGSAVRIELATPTNGRDVVCIRVSDHGPGIAPGSAERIFMPFFTTKEHGIGLGLAIARELVEAHGGSIGVTPGADGVGATFTIELGTLRPN